MRETSVLLCKMSERWSFTLQWRGHPVSSTYCWPHLLHIIRYSTLEDLQEALIITLNCSPVVWLEKAFVAKNIEQVLHLAAPHGWLPGSSCDVDVKDAHTRRSFEFFGQWKVMRDGVGNTLRSCYETWRIDWCCLIVEQKDGKWRWYVHVTTKGVRAGFSWLRLDRRHTSLGVPNTHLMSLSSSCSLCRVLF